MAESADNPPPGHTSLDEESDVIELTDEVAAHVNGDSTDSGDPDSDPEPDQSDDEVEPNQTDSSADEEEADLDMPEFSVGNESDDDSDAARASDEFSPDDAPTTQRLSQEALEKAASRDTDGVLGTQDSSDDDDDSDPETPQSVSGSNDQAQVDGDDYDRQAMVKTIQMDAFDREAVEDMAPSTSKGESVVLDDARFSPEIVAYPPQVLVRKWREGLPGGVELIVKGDKRSKTDRTQPEPSPQNEDAAGEQSANRQPATAKKKEGSGNVPDLPSQTEDEQPKKPEKAAPQAPNEAKATEQSPETVKEQSTSPEPIELADELVELDEADLEEEKVSQKPPPDKPEPETKPTPKNAGSAQPSSAPEQPIQDQPKGAPKQDSEMKGLVEELLEEEKEQKERAKSSRVRPRDIWFKEVFSEEYLRTVPDNISEITENEADFIELSLKLKKQSRVLDLACGFGRHSIELASRGYQMVGLDLSMPLLQRALDAAKKRSLNVKFIHGDMRELNFAGLFDGCFIWDTSLGYFDDRTNLGVLHGVHRAMKVGGRLLIDVVNRDYVIRQTPTRLWWEGNGCIFLEESEFNYQTSTLKAQRSYIYEDGTPPLESTSFIRLYNVHELRQMLHVAGFKVLEVSGARHHKGHFLGAASPRIIVLAEKRKKRRSAKRKKQKTRPGRAQKKPKKD